MYRIADGLARLLAPILPVTADELWQGPARARAARIGAPDRCPDDLETLAQRRAGRTLDDADRDPRSVNAALEAQRQAKVIGTSLEAEVTLGASRRDAGAAAREPAVSSTCCSSSRRPRWCGSSGDRPSSPSRWSRSAGEVRPLLALRPRHLGRAGVRRPVRPLRRALGGAGMSDYVDPRRQRGGRRRLVASCAGPAPPGGGRTELWLAVGLIIADQMSKAADPRLHPAPRHRRGDSRAPQPHARAQHRRRVRLPRTPPTSPTSRSSSRCSRSARSSPSSSTR